MKKKIKIIPHVSPSGYVFHHVMERKYWAGFFPCGRWKTVESCYSANVASCKSVAGYVRQYYQIRLMCDGHYVVYRRYYFFKWYYYAVDDHFSRMFDTEEEARRAVVESLISQCRC